MTRAYYESHAELPAVFLAVVVAGVVIFVFISRDTHCIVTSQMVVLLSLMGTF